MSSISIQPVRNRRDRRTFLTFPWSIYRDDPLWVPPLLPETMRKIDPRRGVFFNRGVAEFFIAFKDGKPAGTICAADDIISNKILGKNDCIFGFFECIDDYTVADALFEQAAAWAGQRGLDSLFGPFNLDYEDSYGILIEGRDRPPVLICGHSPPYYQKLIDQFGFKPARAQNIAFCVNLAEIEPAIRRMDRLAEKIRKKNWVTVRGADLSRWDEEVDRVQFLLNTVLSENPDHIPWHRDALDDSFKQFKKIVDPELILFAEVKGRVVGWFPGIPNINEALIHANGLRYPWNYISLLRYARRQPDCLAVKSVLVLKEYWGTGVPILLFYELGKRAGDKGYKWIDFSITQEDNPQTPKLARQAGARIYKRYQVYRFALDTG